MINHICLEGRIVQTPEMSRTKDGIAVVKFTLANDYMKKDTAFIDCVAWKQTAELIARNMTKGRLCSVEGRLRIRQWIGRDGERRKAAEINVDRFHFLDNKEKNDGGEKGYFTDDSAIDRETMDFPEMDDPDADLPFD